MKRVCALCKKRLYHLCYTSKYTCYIPWIKRMSIKAGDKICLECYPIREDMLFASYTGMKSIDWLTAKELFS